jgi:hypothetical protein
MNAAMNALLHSELPPILYTSLSSWQEWSSRHVNLFPASCSAYGPDACMHLIVNQ